MPEVWSFDNINDAFEFMERNRQTMSDMALPEQKALADGETHWYLSIHDGLPIMGKIFSIAENEKSEAKHYNMKNPEDVAEYEFIVAQLKANLERDVVFVRAYSIVEPDGEYGNVHVASCCPATESAFDEFLRFGCKIVAPELQPNIAKAARVYHELRQKFRSREN